MQIDKVLKKLSADLHEEASNIEKLNFKKTKTLKIELKLLKDLAKENLIKKLDDYCRKIPAEIPVIYVICCPDKNLRKKLREAFKKKKENPGIFKLSKDNKKETIEESLSLYVGSCCKVSKLRRLEEHLTEKNPATYGLHMSTWIGKNKGFIEIYFLYCEKDQPKYIQYVEDALASELKPLFGKTGSNGKS